MSTVKTFEWKRVKVEVEAVGSEPQPWDDKKRHAIRYEVKVSVGRVTHATAAWGSIAEHEKIFGTTQAVSNNLPTWARTQRDADHKGIAAMVVDELASALTDPDEFVSLCAGELTGKKAALAVRRAEETILAAARFGEKILSEAAEQIREEGLL